jgi:hypothetical protein
MLKDLSNLIRREEGDREDCNLARKRNYQLRQEREQVEAEREAGIDEGDGSLTESAGRVQAGRGRGIRYDLLRFFIDIIDFCRRRV